MEQAACTIIKGRRYTVRPVNVTGDTNQSVVIPANCNSWIVENYGTSIARVNGRPCLPPPGAGMSGEAVGADGDPGDVFAGDIIIQFDAGGVNNVWVSFYIYVI